MQPGCNGLTNLASIFFVLEAGQGDGAEDGRAEEGAGGHRSRPLQGAHGHADPQVRPQK